MNDLSGNDVIKMLSRQEEVIASLYATFSNALPEMRQFWDQLVEEEMAHSEVILMLAEMNESEEIYADKKRFNPTAIQTNIDHLTKHINKVASQGITAMRALAMASDIEHSLIETSYFRVITSDSARVQKELQEIERHTKQHCDLIEMHLTELRKSNNNAEV